MGGTFPSLYEMTMIILFIGCSDRSFVLFFGHCSGKAVDFEQNFWLYVGVFLLVAMGLLCYMQ